MVAVAAAVQELGEVRAAGIDSKINEHVSKSMLTLSCVFEESSWPLIIDGVLALKVASLGVAPCPQEASLVMSHGEKDKINDSECKLLECLKKPVFYSQANP